MPAIVALLTDFGARDPYVGATKGAILAACPEATVVDIAHELPAHDVYEGAYCLAAAFRAFPGGTVFLAVVDPGVGSDRRGLAIEAGGYRFVGPDNGIFSLVLTELPEPRVYELTNAGLFRYEVSHTFHARDIFAPVAGFLARGGGIEDVGPTIQDPVVFPEPPVKRSDAGEWEGAVMQIDRFGNLTTNLAAAEMAKVLEVVGGDPTEIVVIVEGVVLPLVRAYGEIPEGEACALMGSSGRLEVAVNRGSAAGSLGAQRGTPVRVRVVTRGGP